MKHVSESFEDCRQMALL